MRMLAVAWLGLMIAGCATLTVNPTVVSWSHADYATAAWYEGGYFAVPLKADGTCDPNGTPTGEPMFVIDLGNPLTGISGSTLLRARPLGCYAYRVRPCDRTGLWGPWSKPSNVFVNQGTSSVSVRSARRRH